MNDENTNNMEENTLATSVGTILDSYYQENNAQHSLDEGTRTAIKSLLSDRESLEDCIATLRDRNTEWEKNESICSRAIESYQQQKKKWTARKEDLKDLLCELMKDLNLKTAEKDGVKVIYSNARKSLFIDNEMFMKAFDEVMLRTRAALPSYIKVSFTIDKAELNRQLKEDASMIAEHPEMIHYNQSESVSFK